MSVIIKFDFIDFVSLDDISASTPERSNDKDTSLKSTVNSANLDDFKKPATGQNEK